MKLIKLYKILSYFLTLPTLIVALFSFIGIFIGLANPAVLLDVFITACTVVYFISSFIFFWKILVAKKTCKKIIKDLIRINGLISIFFVVRIIFSFVLLVSNPTLLSKVIDEAMMLNTANFPPTINKEMMIKFAWFVLSLITIYATVLLVHIIISFKLIKDYATSFLSEQ